MKLPTTLIVRECGDCPFEYDTIRCKHPHGQRDFEDQDQTWKAPPDWCPLRTEGSFTIEIGKV